LALGAMLLLTLLHVQGAVACDAIDIDLWIGDDVGEAEGENEDTVYKCPGDSFGWYVVWDAGTATTPDFVGPISIETSGEAFNAADFTADGDETTASESGNLSEDLPGGDHTVTAWIHREGGEWYESNERTINASDNPSFASKAIAFKKAGYSATNFSTANLEPRRFERVKYDPDEECYCDNADHKTSLGNGFDHAHFPVGFPFTYDIDDDGTPETITAADCRAYWNDNKYSSYTFVSAATVAQNCHGFALGLSTYIDGSGMTTILEDDYVELFGDDISEATIATLGPPTGDPTHSIKIIEWEDGKVKEQSEKMGTSPVYKKRHNTPVDLEVNFRYWKPKEE